jgi:hypothetical protein
MIRFLSVTQRLAVGVFEHKIQGSQHLFKNKCKKTLGTFPNTLDRDVQSRQLVHLLDGPHAALTVQPQQGTTVAVRAQGHAGVLEALLDVVGLTWPGGVTDRAWQGLDQRKVQALFGV